MIHIYIIPYFPPSVTTQKGALGGKRKNFFALWVGNRVGSFSCALEEAKKKKGPLGRATLRGLMQGVGIFEVYVVEEVDGIVQICRSASVKVHGLIHGVGIFEIHVVEKIDGIV